MNQDVYNTEVSQRAHDILNAMADRGTGSLWAAHARLVLGRDLDDLTEIVQRDLAGDTLGFPGAGGPFQVLPAMLLACRWEDRLPTEIVTLIRDFFLHGVLDRGNTENHWMMFYVGNLLAAEWLADEDVMWNGQSPAAVRDEATRWILGTIERTARLGHHEYDSTGYHVEHFTPLVGLYEHTQNVELKLQVEKVLSLLVADMALEYFYGAWAGGHSREGYRENTWTRVGPVRGLHYLYFGGVFDPLQDVQNYAIPVAAAGFRPPALFAKIALDRSQPHVVKKTKAPRNIFRHTDRNAKSVRKYTFLSRSFALGSTQVGLPGPPAGPIDLVSWDLTWDGPKHEAKIVCNHPYRDPRRFSAFLGGLPQSARRAVGDPKPYLQRSDRLFGASPFEQMMQHQGTIIVLYRIPEDDEAPFVNLYLPKSIRWTAQEGWLFGDVGDFYVALRPLAAYNWERICESRNDSTMVHGGDLIDGWLLRMEDVNAGLVLESVEADDVDDFASYCNRRMSKDVDLSRWLGESRVDVETFDGKALKMIYDGTHSVDGEVINYDAWPLYGSPSAQAEVDTGQMRFFYGDQELNLDFGVDPGQSMIPMRVIG